MEISAILIKVRKHRFNLGMGLWIFLWLISYSPLNAQTIQYPDLSQHKQLMLTLQQVGDDSSRVEIFNEMAQLFLYDSVGLARLYASKALDLSKRIGYAKGTTESLNNLATAHEISGSFEEALRLYEAAFAHAKNQKAYRMASDVLVNMAVACYYQNDKAQAISLYNKAIKHAHEFSMLQDVSYIYSDLAAIYQEMGEFHQATRIYKLALESALQSGDKLGYAQTLENLGFLYSLGAQKDTACSYLLEAIRTYRNLDMEVEALQAELSISQVYLEMGWYDHADRLTSNLMHGSLGNVPEIYQSRARLILATIRNNQERYDEAITLLDEGFDLVRNMDEEGIKADYMQQYAQVYQRRHQYERALEYMNRRLSLMDTLNRMDRLDLEREIRAQFSLREQEAALRMEQAEEQQVLRERQWLFALLMISFVLLGVLSVFAVSKMRSNRTLKEKNLIIDQSLQDKEVLIREIQHRVKNNLQIISSLLKLQVRSTHDLEAKEALQKGQERIDSIALIYKNLYQTDKITGVQTKRYIEQLSQTLLRAHPMIKLTTDVEDMILDVDVLVPIGLIVNELICNAVQYGFADNKEGQIMISLKRDGDDLALMVEDDGIGLSQVEMENRNESGFKLIRAYLRKLKGSIHILSNEGTIVHCHFKAKSDQAA